MMTRVLSRLVALLGLLLLALMACSGGGAPSGEPTRPAGQAPGVPKAGVKIVTDVGGGPAAQTTPTATPSPVPDLRPTNTPQPVARLELVSQRSYSDALGALWIVGEATNTGDSTATNVEVKLSLLGGDGKPLATSYATSYLDQVPAGGKMPFGGMFAQPPSGWKDVKVELAATPPDRLARRIYAQGLQVEQVAIATPTSGGGPVVAGQVRNTGSTPALTVRVVAALRGPDGKVVDVADGYVRLPELGPGATSPFSLQFPHARQAGPADVYLQGRLR